MRKSFLTWKHILVLFLFPSIFGRFGFTITVRHLLWASFLNAESAIPLWLTHGTHFFSAVGIAIACSSYDVFFWFCLMNYCYGLYLTKLIVPYKEFESWAEMSERPWKTRVQGIGARAFRFFVPPSRKAHTGWKLHLRLFEYGIIPGGIWPGIGYGIAEGVPWKALLVIEFGNALKMVYNGVFARASMKGLPWLFEHSWVLSIVIFLIPFLKDGATKVFTKKTSVNEKIAPNPCERCESEI